MRISKLEIKKGWFKASLVSVVCLVILLGFLIVREVDTFEDNSNFFEEQFLAERKLELEREVLNRIDEIDYELENIEAKANIFTKERIDHIKQMIENAEQERVATVTDEEFIDRAMDVIIEHAEHDPDYLYFSIGLDGTLHLSGTDKNLEGVNLMGAKDISGKYYAKEMVEAVKASETGEAYISYYWPKEAGGEALLKTSYCKYVESIDRIIGTGVYFEDLEAIVQEEIYKRFQAYYEGKKEYIFVVNYDGIAKVFGDNSMIGKDVRIFKDIDGNPVFDEVMKIVRNEGSGFLTYHFYERDNDKRSRKISYVKGLDHWNVYIGLGFYLDDFYEDTEVYNDKSLEELQLHLIVFIAVFILLMGTAIYFNVKTIDMSKKYFRQEEMLYEKFSNLTTEGILIIDDNDIIHFANPVAMSILQISKEDFGAFKRSQFIASENGTNKVTGFKGRRTFVEMYSDNIFYQEKDYTVLFLSDITEILKYQESLKLTAATDQLTGLSNRRKYIEDFHEGLDKMIEKNMPFSMGLIDLDKFKCVNDTHGHNVGDEVLKTFSKLVRDAIRDHDELYRYGGEEFTIIMLETELKDGKKLLERINKRLQEYEWVQDGLSVSFTAGLIEIDVKNPRELDFYLKKMDILLYKGKKKGRKRVEID